MHIDESLPCCKESQMRNATIAFGVLTLVGCTGRPTNEWVDQLKAVDSKDRIHAIRALSERPADAETVVPALSDSLKDRDPFIRRDAAQALAKLGPNARAALPALRPLLKDKNHQVRRAAEDAIKKIDRET
jgi:HEAT repeat protein